MYNLIRAYVNKISLNDIFKFATSNEVNLSSEEAKFILDFMKKNWEIFLNNPDSLNLDNYKSQFSEENFLKVKKLINFYEQKYAYLLKH